MAQSKFPATDTPVPDQKMKVQNLDQTPKPEKDSAKGKPDTPVPDKRDLRKPLTSSDPLLSTEEQVYLRNPGESATHYEKVFHVRWDDTELRDEHYRSATRQDAINHGLRPLDDAYKASTQVSKLLDKVVGYTVTYEVPVVPAAHEDAPIESHVDIKDEPDQPTLKAADPGAAKIAKGSHDQKGAASQK